MVSDLGPDLLADFAEPPRWPLGPAPAPACHAESGDRNLDISRDAEGNCRGFIRKWRANSRETTPVR